MKTKRFSNFFKITDILDANILKCGNRFGNILKCGNRLGDMLKLNMFQSSLNSGNPLKSVSSGALVS